MPPKPTLLAFDTSAAHCAAVLVQGGKVKSPIIEPMQKGQTERLFPLLEEILAEHQTSWTDLDAIVVCTGPGNFTGVRISVASARGLALSLGIPAIGVSRLQAIAQNTSGNVTAAVDARQGRHYVQQFEDGQPVGDISLIGSEQLAAHPFLLSDNKNETLSNSNLVTPETLLQNLAKNALPLIGTSQARPAPIYAKAPDASLSADHPPRILP